MNKVILIGNLTAKPELRQTQGGAAVTTMTVAVARRYNKDMTDFVPVVAWRQLAENCAKHLDKGRKVCVVGELNSRRYEDKDGKKRTVWEITAEDVQFLDKILRSAQDDKDVNSRDELPDAMPDDDDLPF